MNTTPIKDVEQMTDRELMNLYEFAEFMPEPFPATRVAEVAVELGRRAHYPSHIIFRRMRRLWGGACRPLRDGGES